MKKLMKLMIAVAVMACAAGAALAGGVVADESIVTKANLLTFTNSVDIGGDRGFRSVEKIVLQNNSTSTAALTFAIDDFGGVFTTIATNDTAAAGTATIWPVRAVANGSTTNAPYSAGKLRIITTLGSTNAVVSTVKVRIYAGD